MLSGAAVGTVYGRADFFFVSYALRMAAASASYFHACLLRRRGPLELNS